MFRITLVVFSLFALTTTPVSASIKLTEVHPNPLSGSEWVEILNDSTEPQSLQGWSIEDQLSSPSVAFSFTTQVLLPQSYLVIELPTSKLNNTADGVTLKNATGQVIDTFSYTSTTAGLSWSRPSSSNDWIQTQPTPGFTHPQTTPSPTPTPTSTPSPSPSATTMYPLNLQPSEIMACPGEGETEWLELYNPNEDDVTLSNWLVQDNAQNVRLVSTTIPAKSYTAVSWTGSLLNNTGDTLSLLTPSSQTLFTVSFGACQKEHSFILEHHTWQLTSQVTKNAANVFTTFSAIPADTQTASPSAITLLEATPTPEPSASQPPQPHKKPHPAYPSISSLKLSTTPKHPFATPSSTLVYSDFPPSTPSKMHVISAIMGGGILILTNTLLFYLRFVLPHATDSFLPPLSAEKNAPFSFP